MFNLDNLKQIEKFDSGRVGESISLLPDQIRQVLEEVELINIPAEYADTTQVVVNGMGGSNLGAGVVKSLFTDQLKKPISIAPGYVVPACVNDKTLFVISSYSGTTEEPLSVYKEVKKRGAKILAITSEHKKNKLAQLMLKDNIPGYIFKAEKNPSNQPRLGLGYSIFGMAALLAKSGLFKVKIDEVKKLISNLELRDRKLRPSEEKERNIAKQLAGDLYGKEAVLVGAEFLIGNLRILRNQLCENSKNFASYLTLPEMNHYALESLANPKSNAKNLLFLFFDSKLYSFRTQKRSALTNEVVRKNHIKTLNYVLKGKTKLEQSFEMLQVGSWVTFYLAMLNNVNPAEIQWVDWFKQQLK